MLERALTLCPDQLRAELNLTLARALWAAGTERPRAVALAREASAFYESIGNQRELATTQRWLAEHWLPAGQ